MFPARIHIITCNIWSDYRWAFRENTLRAFLTRFDPDVLCLQELHPVSRAMIDEALPGHRRIEDAFPGWVEQSNIYWRDSMFSEIEHGATDVGIRYQGTRRLFWARLQMKGSGRSVLVATAHLTHQRHPDEIATGQSPRVAETTRIIAELKRLNREREPLFFTGDLNDPVHPPGLLHEAGYVSCFAALGLQSPPTFKCYPTADVAPGAQTMTQCVDWIAANAECRALCAAVPQFYMNDSAPSDHWPVQAMYEIKP